MKEMDPVSGNPRLDLTTAELLHLLEKNRAAAAREMGLGGVLGLGESKRGKGQALSPWPSRSRE